MLTPLPRGCRPPCETLEDAREMLVPRSTSIDKPHVRNLAVLLKSPDPSTEPEMIGIVGIPRWPPGLWTHLQAGRPLDTFQAQGELDAPELGYGINMKHWGKGYTSEATGAFLKYFWSLTGMFSSFIFLFFLFFLLFFFLLW